MKGANISTLIWAIAALIAIGLLLAVMVNAANAQMQRTPGYIDHPPAGQADPYTGIKNRDGSLCCSGDDCKKALPEEMFNILPGKDERYQVRSTGEVVQHGQVADSPDGNWHICRRADLKKTIRCLMVPQGGY